MSIGPREKLFIWIAVAALAVIAVAAIFVFPQWSQIGEVSKQVEDYTQQVNSAKSTVSLREESKNKTAETNAKWLRIANLVPEGPDLPSFIVELQDAAFASGVQMMAVTPSDPNPKTDYYAIPVEVQVLGTWSDTVDFLQRVIKLNRGVRITETDSKLTDNETQFAKENVVVPDYSELTTVKIEAYMIPSSASTSTASGTAPTTPSP